MKRKFRLFLKDILDNGEKIHLFIGSMGYDDFCRDEKTIYAVARCLEIIGESVAYIPEEFRKEHPTVPWSDLKSFRNQVIHKYWNLDLEILWDIIQNYIDPLKEEIGKILDEEE
ncbi:DUF86 domain-containing protein [Candidatus Woesearchaeota archaeon]|nr:MAG: hypothetical protein QS99_C0012G0031 [archaeon GW2011_AR4]MBS3130647.1 DUF86 domain-containing protein [Candidatus Woesearchaeota archaeon]HIH37958.1 DUF86 domain-containing protein [Candidatus Woesearchaeota archaeon]HIH48652.1 DUF86 domain-containing protein [Candidatus Woesearchaeota archaeon]HIJ03737.1 DUF86 domain-containing protein [Candidatus Woesearchaeota archaeon]